MRPLRIEMSFSPAEAERIANLMDQLQEHTLAKRFHDTIERETRYWEAAQAAQQAEEERRAQRAKHHVLTERQAQALAAARAGRSVHEVPWSWTDNGVVNWRWRYAGSMGGAVRRMVETLIEEGLLTDNRKLTDAGRIRLEAYEAKHGRVGP